MKKVTCYCYLLHFLKSNLLSYCYILKVTSYFIDTLLHYFIT